MIHRRLAAGIEVTRLTIAIFILVLMDHLTKLWSNLAPGPLYVGYGFALHPTTNTGGAWSLGEHTGLTFMYISIGLGLLISGVWFAKLVHYLVHATQTNQWVISIPAAVLIIAGSIGNTIDRVVYGHVVDFIDFQIGTWSFAIFNFADIWITAGVALYISQLLIDNLRTTPDRA